MIFVIDDDQSLQRAFVILLRSAGLDARAFSSAQDFLMYSNVTDNDCIILDLRMPGMNGFDLMKKLRAKCIQIPIICVTAFDAAESREQAQELGASAYFTKPVDDQALIDAITWATQRKKIQTSGGVQREKKL